MKVTMIRGARGHKNALLEVGEDYDLDVKLAHQLINSGKALKFTESDDALIEAAVEAIDSLDPKNENEFTKSGKPEIQIIEELIGKSITAAQRDKAWEIFNQE